MVDNIAICGSHPATLRLAPKMGEPGWKRFMCSPRNFGEAADVWFEVRPLENLRKEWPWHETWLAKQPRVMMNRVYPEIPGSEAYPIEAMRAEFGGYFWTSTVALMLAQAIMEAPKTIGVFGVMMSTDEEYSLQRPGFHYFVTEARRRGIEVTTPPAAAHILETPEREGFDEAVDPTLQDDAFLTVAAPEQKVA